MKENDIREDMNGIKFEILRDDEERKKDQLKRLQAYVEAIQKKVSSHTDESCQGIGGRETSTGFDTE